jgi:glucose-1-phosphate thymidylyltransferase
MAGQGEIVGLIPAAGAARRLGASLRGSKEVLPIAGAPVCAHLLGAMRLAGIARALWVVRAGKEDIARTLGAGTGAGGPVLEYLTIESSASVPETLSHGIRHLGDRSIAMGFPDVIAEPRSALGALVDRFHVDDPDLVLGLFPTARPDKADLVRVDGDGSVLDILHKPGTGTGLSFTWLLAVWRSTFSRRLLTFVERGEGPAAREPQVSDVVKAALADGLRVDAVAFPNGSHLDVGTPEDLELARISQRSET